jgi:hypothetical protein
MCKSLLIYLDAIKRKWGIKKELNAGGDSRHGFFG